MTTKYTITAWCFDKQGKCLSTATNSYKKTHPLQAYFAKRVGHPHKIYLHAELAAILRVKYTDRIHSIRILRMSKNLQLALAKPCPICMEAIKAFGIEHISYSTSTGFINHDPSKD